MVSTAASAGIRLKRGIAAGRIERGGDHAGVQEAVLLRQRLRPWPARSTTRPGSTVAERGADGRHRRLAREDSPHPRGEIAVLGFDVVGHGRLLR